MGPGVASQASTTALPHQVPPSSVPPRPHPQRERERFKLLGARGFRKAESFDSIAQRDGEGELARCESNPHVTAERKLWPLLVTHTHHREIQKAREGTHRRSPEVARRGRTHTEQIPALVAGRGAERTCGVAQLEAEPGTHAVLAVEHQLAHVSREQSARIGGGEPTAHAARRQSQPSRLQLYCATEPRTVHPLRQP